MGLLLLGAGIGYFMLFGKLVLPAKTGEETSEKRQRELIDSWQLPVLIHELVVPPASDLIGRTREETMPEQDYHLHLIALADGDEILYVPWRHAHFAAGQVLALIGERNEAERFATTWKLDLLAAVEHSEELQNPANAGFAELIVAPHSSLIGTSTRDISVCHTYQLESLLLLSEGKTERGDFSGRPLHAGDALVVHGRWHDLKTLAHDQNFLVATPVEAEDIDESKGWIAGLCFAGAIALALSGAQLSLALMSGALTMILLRVTRIDDAYRSVDWRTVFLLDLSVNCDGKDRCGQLRRHPDDDAVGKRAYADHSACHRDADHPVLDVDVHRRGDRAAGGCSGFELVHFANLPGKRTPDGTRRISQCGLHACRGGRIASR